MKTMQAEYKTDIAMLAADNAKRDKDNLCWQVGLWIAAVVMLGVLIRLHPPVGRKPHPSVPMSRAQPAGRQ